MGFNFMYIGRDENTLNDTLDISKRWDRLPLEMKVPSMTGQITAPLKTYLGLDIDTILSNPKGVDLQEIVETVSKHTGMNLTAITSALAPGGKLPIIGTRTSPNIPFGGVHINDFDITPMLASSGGIFNASWLIESGGISMNPIEPFQHLMLASLDGKNVTFTDLMHAAAESLKEIPSMAGLASFFNFDNSTTSSGLGPLGGILGGLTGSGGFNLGALAPLLGGLSGAGSTGAGSTGGLGSLASLFGGLAAV
jgi:hypothetical protein